MAVSAPSAWDGPVFRPVPPRASLLEEEPPEGAALCIVAYCQELCETRRNGPVGLSSDAREDRPPIGERAVLDQVIEGGERQAPVVQMAMMHGS
jgi:hypothetical protein